MAVHNSQADFGQLGVYHDQVWDSLYLSWLVDENSQHGLKPLSSAYLGRKLEDPIRVTDAGVTEFKVGNRYVHIADAPQDLVRQYCEEDARATRDLVLKLWPLLNDQQKTYYLDTARVFLRKLWKMEATGLPVDPHKLLQETFALRIDVADARKRVFAEVGYEFNLDSGKQLGNVLFKRTWTTKEKQVVGTYKTGPRAGEEKLGWVDADRKGLGLRPTKRTETGLPSTDDEALGDLADHPAASTLVNAVLDYRESSKVLGTYLESFPRFIGSDGRLRGNFNATGTRTGRLSSNRPNLQNIPSRGSLGKRVRGLFAPGAGRVLVVADLDQIEYRLLASFSGERALIDTFSDGGDIHARTAALMGAAERAVGKTLNYAVVYGAGPKKIAQTLTSSGVRTSPKEARVLLDRYYSVLPLVVEWKEKVLSFARTHRAVVTLAKRVRHLPSIHSHDRNVQSRTERQAINSVVQGSAADVMIGWMLALPDELTLCAQVHDELVVECDQSEAEDVARVLVNALDESVKQWGLQVPVTTEAKIVENWGAAK